MIRRRSCKLRLEWEYWNRLIETGYITTKNEEGKMLLKKRINETLHKGNKEEKETIHLFFSELELEFNDFGESYTDTLKTISEKSNQLFNPKNIIETEQSDCIHISFELNNKLFECDLHRGRISDTNIFWLVNKSLKFIKSEILLGSLFAGWDYQSNFVDYIFINKEVYDKMKKLHIVPDYSDDMYFTKKCKIKFEDHLENDDGFYE